MNKKLKAKIFEEFGTQYDFSRAVVVHESHVSKVVQGRRTLKQAERRRWADLLEADSLSALCTEGRKSRKDGWQILLGGLPEKTMGRCLRYCIRQGKYSEAISE